MAAAIQAEGGRVTFARFMELALTHPTAGYYSRVGHLLRHGGDFSTAPALSPFFNRTLARLVTELVDASLAAAPKVPPAGAAAGLPALVELGGGEGHLAREILRFWERERPELRRRVGYRILEAGARLRETQASAVGDWIAAGWRVGWGATLEETCAGMRPVVIVGNEFLDTIPVHVVDVAGGVVREVYVESVSTGLVHVWGDLSEEATAEIESLFGAVDPERLATLTEDGTLELFPGLGRLMGQVARSMPYGSLVSIDYGDWYAGTTQAGHVWGVEERRRRRTVRGYFKHQVVDDLLARVGRQDLTADVDFAAVNRHGREKGFETVVFTTLAAFLRGGGADAELRRLQAAAESARAAPEPVGAVPAVAAAAPEPVATAPEAPQTLDAIEADRQATVLESLADERGLGGAFKLMVQVKE